MLSYIASGTGTIYMFSVIICHKLHMKITLDKQLIAAYMNKLLSNSQSERDISLSGDSW
jgi:hypothetical protein